MPRWSKEEAFPIIKHIIEQLCQKYGSADRDQIALALLEDDQGKQLVEFNFNKSKRILFDELGNIVDWFSAELTNDSKISAPYTRLYKRERVKRTQPETGKHREIWLYYLAYQLNQPEMLPEEIDEDEVFVEGMAKVITVNAYERNPKARKQCIDHYGKRCIVCGFDFHEFYGSVGDGYIQVHHLKPLSEIREAYEIDPVVDLRPVCANCHTIIHRRNPPYTIEEVKEFTAPPNTSRQRTHESRWC
jgi:hypothetical protein